MNPTPSHRFPMAGAANSRRASQKLPAGDGEKRFLWMHPFLEGNGRVARLMSQALLKRFGIGTSLWSIACGLVREEAEYKSRLTAADRPRHGDRVGRGNLIQSGLLALCRFFLARSIDQVTFMERLLDLSALLQRMEIHIAEEVRAKRLGRGSFMVGREAALAK